MKWSELTPAQRNALIAEKIMGWNPETPCPGAFVSCEEQLKCHTCGAWAMWGDPRVHKPLTPPRYSEDMNAAWQIVKHFDEAVGWNPATFWSYSDHFLENIATTYDHYSDHYTSNEAIFSLSDLAELTPERICLAALRTVDVEMEP